MKKAKKVVVTKNGPYLVSGNLPLIKEISTIGEEGEPEKWVKGKKYLKQNSYVLCRCGKSKNKPFCDGTHIEANFKGEETAERVSYKDQSEKLPGPNLDLTDASNLCAGARFCHLSGGTWNNVKNSDNPKARKIAIQTACNCPSGRLVVWDKKTGKAIEPKLDPTISLIEDPQAKVSGPIWLKGGIPLESEDGRKYQTRNRATLCRCGHSQNKPFCDGSHLDARFNDGDESLK
jgi:CDGSH-type Zn-finger protein